MLRATRIGKTTIGLCSAGLAGLALAGLTTAASAKDLTVHISGANYGALPTGLKVGDTITWINDDTVAHTVTARDHSFDLHLNPGQNAKLTIQKDGATPIYCIYHSTMRGTLTATR